MLTWMAPLAAQLPKLSIFSLVDILVTAFLIYQFLTILKGRRAANVLVGLGVLVGMYVVAFAANLELLRTVLQTIAPYTPLGLILMFQQEIRRMLARLGRQGGFGFVTRLKRREFVEEILLAVEQLSRMRTGALIVLERDIGLRTFIESGVSLDAIVSRDLLMAIFHPKAALHDGAVIIQNDRVAAAACFLPLSSNTALASTMGTRHRAGIGVTEDSDCLAIVVSEESGQLSVAEGGEMQRDLTLSELETRIVAHLRGTDHRAAAFTDRPVPTAGEP
jgi:diadenylate cyclase